MAKAGAEEGAFKHLVLAKPKGEVSKEILQQKLKLFSILPAIVPGMKTLHWGIDESIRIKHHGYPYVFECTFDSMDDIEGYYEHPGHLAFANQTADIIEDHIVLNYKPIYITK